MTNTNIILDVDIINSNSYSWYFPDEWYSQGALSRKSGVYSFTFKFKILDKFTLYSGKDADDTTVQIRDDNN